MPLIRQTIPNLVGGVSQQPDAMRLEGQCTEQINAYSDPTNGLRKRNRIDFLRKKDITIEDDDICQFITRDKEEKYVAVTSSDKLRIFNLDDGEEATIVDSSGTSHSSGLTISSGDYLESSNYREDLKFLSVGDTTYVVNKEIQVAQNADLTDEVSNSALIFVKQGAEKTNYDLRITHNQGGSPDLFTITVTTEIQTARQGPFTRITSVSVLNGGAGYLNGTREYNVLPADSREVYRQGVIKVTFTNGVATSVSIVDKGAYGFANPAGSWTYTGPVPDNPNPPNFTEAVIQTRTASESASKSDGGYDHSINDSTTKRIAEAIYADLVGHTSGAITSQTPSAGDFFSATLNENLIELSVNDTQVTNMQYSIVSTDGLADNGLGVIYKEVNSITDLPLYCKNGFVTKVIGGNDTADDYYVKFVTKDNIDVGNGYWVETVGFNIVKGYDADTFIHELVLTSEDEFTFRTLNVTERIVGDDATNPLPSFVGERVNNVFFYRNRLGILSNDKVILSEAGLGLKKDDGILTYNFFRTTVQTLLDSDPIDITVATDKITNLRSAIPFQDNLILFSDNTQFSLDTAGQLLSPNSVSVSPLTEFDAVANINPKVIGDSVYFPVDKAEYLEMREYLINKTTESYESFTITNAVPTYIPAGIRELTYSTTQSCVALTSGTDLKTIYIYKFLNLNGKKVQNSWSKFTVPFDVHGLNFEKDVLTIIMKYADGSNDALMQTEMTFSTDLLEPTEVYPVSASDRSQVLVDMAFTATMDGSGSTTNVPIPFPTAGLTLATDASDWEVSDKTFHSLVSYSSTLNTLNFSHISNSVDSLTVGLKYNMVYQFSEFVIKQKNENIQTAINVDHRLKNMSLYYTNAKGPTSGNIGPRFELKIKSPRTSLAEGNPHTTTFGEDEYELYDLVDGFFTVSVFTSAEDVEISLEQPYKYQVNFQNVNIESIVRDRARPY
jgi:hypothetical protein